MWLADARARDAWAHTSCILAKLHNCHRGAKSDPIAKPQDFNPFYQDERRRGCDIMSLKPLFKKKVTK